MAILLPRITGARDSATRQASRPQAMKALARTTLLTLHGDSPSAFRHIAEFVDVLPAYWLELGTEIDQIPATIDELLEHLRR